MSHRNAATDTQPREFPFPRSFKVVSSEPEKVLEEHMRTANLPRECRTCFMVEVVPFDEPDITPGTLRLYVTVADLSKTQSRLEGVGDGYGNVEEFAFTAIINLARGEGSVTVS